MTEPPQNQVSPEATGGAGTIEEYALGAVAMARLLTGDLLPGFATAPTSIALQRRVAENALDDLVVRSRTVAGETGIDFQIKRTASPVMSDDAFVGVLEQCLKTMRQRAESLADGSLRLGFAAAGPRGPLGQLKRLTEIARAHSTVGTFLGVLVPGATHRDIRDRFKYVKAAVAEASMSRKETAVGAELDELTHRILKYLRVWIFEAGDDGRDVLEAISRLATLLPVDGPNPHQVFTELRILAETWGPSAGVIDAPMIRSALQGSGIPLTADPRHQVELSRVLEASRQELDRTVDQMGGTLSLERSTAAQELATAIEGGGVVLVSGVAGVGKSVLARRAVRAIGDHATVVVLSLTARGGDTIATVQQELGVSHLGTVLASAPTTGPRVLLIDGAEHALTDSGRLLDSLMGAAPTDGANVPPWTVVITSRADAAQPLVDRLATRLTTHVTLEELSAPEVDEVADTFPSLTPLTRHPRSQRLLSRPYLVDLLVRSQVSPAEGQLMGEEDVIAVVHEKIVRRNEGMTPGRGSAHDRDTAWNHLAEAVVAGTGSSRLAGVDGEAIGGLLSDDVLIRKSSTYRFAHDVLADYACAIRLSDDDREPLLEAVSTPRSLIRAVRLSIQRRLTEVRDDPDEIRRIWKLVLELCSRLSARDGSRWDDLPFEALISMGGPGAVLSALTPILLNDDGTLLSKLIDVTGRYATTSKREPDGDDLQIDDVLAAPVVSLLTTLGSGLPERLTTVATQLAHRWLLSVELNGRSAKTFLPDPTELSAAVAIWADDDTYGDRFESALAAIGLLGSNLSDEARVFLDCVAQRGHDLDVVAEDPEVAAALARDNPDLLLELAGSYYLDLPITLDPAAPPRRPARPRLGDGRVRSQLSGYEDEEGVRRHSHRTAWRQGFGLAGPNWGPFKSLLAQSSEHGLRLTGAVVDAATEARIRVEKAFGAPPPVIRLPLQLPHWDTAIDYNGPVTAWGWYRRSGSGSYVAMSALLALREWATAQLQTRPLADVLDDVLRAGASLAFPAVAYSLLVADLNAAGEVIDTFLEHPDVWDLENGRVVSEGVLTYPDDDKEGLRKTPDQIVCFLVLTGDAERREALKEVGQRLLDVSRLARDNPPDDDPRMSVQRARALRFDASTYQTAPSAEQPGMFEISLHMPADVQEDLDRNGGRAAMLSLTLSNRVFAAIQIRDREKTEPRAAELYIQVNQTLDAIQDTPGADPVYPVDDTRAAVAAAIIVQAASDETAPERSLLSDAVANLVEVANGVEHEPDSYRSGRDMSWDFGADRSAASALPVVLLDDGLLAASGVDRHIITAAVTRLGSSASRQVHHRLIQALEPTWSEQCDTDPTRTSTHDAAMASYKEMLLSAGIGPWNGFERPHVRLTEPLADALKQEGRIFDLPAAADALPGLKEAAQCGCAHGAAARATLDTLIEHDLTTWPTKWARHRYRGSDIWRHEIDQWVAGEILADNDTRLDRYLASFARVPEELTGLIAALADQALTAEQVERLFAVWPKVLDHLLPGARHVPDPGEERPSWRRMAGLDTALLLKRPKAAVWPGQAWAQSLTRWMAAYAPQPSLCDRLIECLASQGHAITPAGVSRILLILGDNYARIMDDSRYVTAWLHIVLLDQPDGLETHRLALRQMVDGLAAQGSPEAIAIQRELEL